MSTEKTDKDIQGENFIREVEEELQAEKLLKIWEKYGSFLTTCAVIVVVGAAGFVGYKEYNLYQQGKASDMYYQAQQELEANNWEKASTLLAELESSPIDGYRLFAYLSEARAELRENNATGAVAVYEEAYKDGNFPELYKDFILIAKGYAALDDEAADLSALDAEITALTTRATSWLPSAYEIKALIAMKQGNEQKALTHYQMLLSGPLEAPNSLRKRAESMIKVLENSPNVF